MVKRSLFIKVLIFLGIFLVSAGNMAKVNAQGVILKQLTQQEIHQIGERVLRMNARQKRKI